MPKLFYLLISMFFGAALFALSFHDSAQKVEPGQKPQRIVSLAPAITETLFALGLGGKVVGVTRFCSWPDEAQAKPKVGGFRDVNLEAIARTKPDLAILPADMAHFKKQIEDLGIPVMLFRYDSLENYLEDVQKLGKGTGSQEANALVAKFAGFMDRKAAKNRPRVLFALLNPDEYDRPLTEMTIIGNDGFYNGIIRAAGGENAYKGATPFPRISLEAVIAMNPDIIVVGAPAAADVANIEKNWRAVGHLQGVKGERLLILNDPGDTIPGPRALETLRKLERAVQQAGEDS